MDPTKMVLAICGGGAALFLGIIFLVERGGAKETPAAPPVAAVSPVKSDAPVKVEEPPVVAPVAKVDPPRPAAQAPPPKPAPKPVDPHEENWKFAKTIVPDEAMDRILDRRHDKIDQYTRIRTKVNNITLFAPIRLYVHIPDKGKPALMMENIWHGRDWLFVQRTKLVVMGQPYEFRFEAAKRDVIAADSLSERVVVSISDNAPLLRGFLESGMNDELPIRFYGADGYDDMELGFVAKDEARAVIRAYYDTVFGK